MTKISTGVTPAQYRAAWQRGQVNSPERDTFGNMMTDAQRAELAAQKKADQENPPLPPNHHWGYQSPLGQLGTEYRAWKAEQSLQELPDPQGLTDKNLAYLQRRYAGPLSWNQRLEALETLESLGVVSTEQACSALGITSGFSVFDVECPRAIYGEPVNPWTDQWERLFVTSPACKFDSFDDILAWVAGLTEK